VTPVLQRPFYNLFKQIVSGTFMMVGDGSNKKSMVPLRSVKTLSFEGQALCGEYHRLYSFFGKKP
jgi:hypothetical protein